jgi:hypothetical protein
MSQGHQEEARHMKRRSGPKDNKIDLPFDEALDRLLAAKPTKKKAAKPKRKKRAS